MEQLDFPFVNLTSGIKRNLRAGLHMMPESSTYEFYIYFYCANCGLRNNEKVYFVTKEAVSKGYTALEKDEFLTNIGIEAYKILHPYAIGWDHVCTA
jgi:hypothetical protein